MLSFGDYISKKSLEKYLEEYFDKKISSYSYKKIYSSKLQYLHDNRKKVIKTLIHEILSGKYTSKPVLIKNVVIEGKKRKIHYYEPLDDFICFVLQKAFLESSDLIFHKNLYSYQKGISKIKPAKKFCKYIKTYIKNNPEVKTRELYVLRRDIKNYGENIPVHPDSDIWRNLEETIDIYFIKDKFFKPVKDLILQLANPVIKTESNESYCNIYGIADGGSLACVLLNLYLNKIDKTLSNIYGGFYARYGDDMIFSHSNYEKILLAEQIFKNITEELRLEFNDNKSLNYYFNGAGNKNSHIKKDFISTQKINYLGNTINFKGNIEIRNDKLNKFLKEFEIRIRSTNKILESDKKKKLSIYSNILSKMLDPSNPKYSTYINELKLLNSKSQIKEIDYKLRAMILKELSGNRSVKFLREYSFNNLINIHGIQSFKYYINR